jgi:hypothetical protein
MSFEFLEISSNNKINSSDFNYTFKKPITLNNGDSVNIHSIFLDTRRQATGTINIPSPGLPISMEFYYYTINGNYKKGQVNSSGIPINSEGTPLPNPDAIDSQFHGYDGLPYILKCQYNGTDFRPLIGVWNYTIPAGNYQPQDLAALISKNMQSANIGNLMNPPTQDTILLYPETRGANTYITPFITAVWNSSRSILNSEEAYDSQSLNPNDPSFTNLPNYVMFSDSTFYNQTIDVPYRRYYFGPLIENSIYPPYFYNEYVDDNSTYISYQIGPDSPALEFNTDGSGRFSLNNLHRPLRQEGKNVVSVNIARHYDISENNTPKIKRSDNTLTVLTADTGILLKSLNPPQFWINTLGFDTSAITLDITDYPNEKIPKSKFLQCTSEQLWTISALNSVFYNGTIKRGVSLLNNSGYPADLSSSPSNAPVGQSFNELSRYDAHLNPACFPNDDSVYKQTALTWSVYKSYSQTFQQDDTRFLSAVLPYQDPDDQGHYLVEIQGIGNNEYTNDSDSFNIHGIISKYYIQNNFLSGEASASLTYIHQGAPLTTKSVNIRILNPSTKTPARLGQSNYLYLQLIHQPQDAQTTAKQQDAQK